MIVARLIGGLGNQMFQYAAGRALALHLNTPFLLDLRAFNDYQLHAYGLNRFKIKTEEAAEEQLKKWPNWQARPCKLLHRLGLKTHWYFEPDFTYNPRWLSLKKNTFLNGYFQSEKYFIHHKQTLIDEFTPIAPLSERQKSVEEEIRKSNSVMIHVRRGDYLTPATLKVHGICSLEYYRQAIQQMKADIKELRFFVFSNDLQWAHENLPLHDDAVFVDGNKNQPEVDCYLMSQCKHHIIANSSFSWWAAWLSSSKEKKVITPTPWFNTTTINAKDLIPPDWINCPK